MKSALSLIAGLLILVIATHTSAAAQLIDLTQAPCQILEAEAARLRQHSPER